MLEVISVICCIIILCIILVLLESFRECRKYKITKYTLSSPKLQESLRVLLLADLHNSDYKDNHAKMLEDINALKPDCIVLAGDMIVSHSDQQKENKRTAEFIEKMSELAPVYYGVGNHEKRAMLSKKALCGLWNEYMNLLENNSNVYFLSNTSEYIDIKGNKINILGLDLDVEYYKRFVEKKLTKKDLEDMFGSLNLDQYNILIAHNPDYFKIYADYGADLVCSGHNHGGLVKLPFIGGVISPRFRIFPKYDYGVFEKENTNMVLTSGLGAHSIKIRVNNIPELVVIDINKEK